MARKKRGGYSAIATINITPFTDVVLVLLIIFMIATPLLMLEGIRINLPAMNIPNNPVEKESTFVSISISADGIILVDGQERSPNDLKTLLQEIIRLDPSIIIAIGAHADTPYETVVRVIDTARAAGIDRYVLVK